jgi:hypothetical protein
MKKDITTCFRTSEVLRGALEAVARGDRRSLSSSIELILTDYLKKNRDFPEQGPPEKRRCERRRVVIPAHVKTGAIHAPRHGAVILDMSLGGMCLFVSRECVSQIHEAGEESQFEASFLLPESYRGVRFICRIERVVPSAGNDYMGASFVNAEFSDYQQLQQYLI